MIIRTRAWLPDHQRKRLIVSFQSVLSRSRAKERQWLLLLIVQSSLVGWHLGNKHTHMYLFNRIQLNIDVSNIHVSSLPFSLLSASILTWRDVTEQNCDGHKTRRPQWIAPRNENMLSQLTSWYQKWKRRFIWLLLLNTHTHIKGDDSNLSVKLKVDTQNSLSLLVYMSWWFIFICFFSLTTYLKDILTLSF
jgi:hypothetical protein